MERQTQSWRAFEQGTTIGTRGSEAGLIVLDEEYDGAARISFERATRVAPFAITCGVYGRLMHTRYFGGEIEATSEYEAMKVALKEIVDGFDSEEEQEQDVARRALYHFVERVPT